MINMLCNTILLGSVLDAKMMYAIPLVVVISLVYGATRDEKMPAILINAFRFAVWIVGFMAVIFIVLWLAGRNL